MKEEFESPVYHVHRVPLEKVRANSYNPNHVAAPEMKLLELSIWEDGYTMPCVCYYIPDEDIYELVDGYHRYCVLAILFERSFSITTTGSKPFSRSNTRFEVLSTQ